MSYKQLFRTFAGTEERRMQEIGFVVFPGFQVMGLSAITAFEVANLVLEKPAYEQPVPHRSRQVCGCEESA